MSNTSKHEPSRRKFIKKLAYVPPVVMTLTVVPSYATTGSQRSKEDVKEIDFSGGESHSSHGRRGRRGWFHRFLHSFGL